ncbi:MAG: PPC domain-containing protein, partial [Myxococcota bacterium]
WTARIPSLRPGEDGTAEETFYILVSATDNDDEGGTGCDNRTDSPVIAFEAVFGEGSGELLELCEPCAASAECSSAFCAAGTGGNRCAERCSGDGVCSGAGSCGATQSVEGSVIAGCSSEAGIVALCDGGGGGGGSCPDDDAREAGGGDDTLSQATDFTRDINDGVACAFDSDYFSYSVPADTRLQIELGGFDQNDGDLDVQLIDPLGSIIAAGETSDSPEFIDFCFADATTAFVRVFGYEGDENTYSLAISEAPGNGECCQADGLEPNDAPDDATELRLVSAGAGRQADELATLCGGDSDYFSFTVSEPSDVEVRMLIDDAAADLDIQLFQVVGDEVRFIDESDGTTSEELIEVRLNEPGEYLVYVFAFDGASTYVLGVTTQPASGCVANSECAVDQVCNAGSCESRACTSSFQCPAEGDYICPTGGPDGTAECGESCGSGADCRAAEDCKWYPQGRHCGRRGRKLAGETCQNPQECSGVRTCINWPGGMCTRAGCASDADCESDFRCIDGGTGTDGQPVGNVCAPQCFATVVPCRDDDYRCETTTTVEGGEDFVCVPR